MWLCGCGCASVIVVVRGWLWLCDMWFSECGVVVRVVVVVRV